MNSATISSGLERRKGFIVSTQNYLDQTKQLFDEHGSEQMKSTLVNFDAIQKSLASGQQVKLVVIGEFSRGKSSLVNALMGIELLTVANEATTAINTFLQKLPENRTKRFIRVHFHNPDAAAADAKPVLDIEWPEGDDTVLEKWSTELEETNADVRKDIERIEIFLDHPLLSQDLVLIDTPGLQSMVQHHEEITRRAIAESHIALWVQATTQLGGNATEWQFLSATIQRNFNKFLTVINMWDNVLDPQDSRDKKKSEEQRVSEKLQHVRNNFEQHLAAYMKPEQLAQITNSDHLMGVSARWALDKYDLVKQERSNIQFLAQRIGEMLSSGEALEQVYKKPLKTLEDIQGQLEAFLNDTIVELESPKSLAERQRESAALAADIKILQQEIETANLQANHEHQHHANEAKVQIAQQLVQPLQALQNEIEAQITEGYVLRQIKQKSGAVNLPAELHQEFESTMQAIQTNMQAQSEYVTRTLQQLRTDYADAMQQHVSNLDASLSKLNIELPPLDVTFHLDFSEVNAYEESKMRLYEQVQHCKAELEAAEDAMSRNTIDPSRAQAARDNLQRAERLIAGLGARPPVERYPTSDQVPSTAFWGLAGLFGAKETVTGTGTDDSAQQAYDAERQRLLGDMAKREDNLGKIQAEEQARRQEHQLAERRAAKYAQEIEAVEQERQRTEKEVAAKLQEMALEIHKNLIQRTVGEIQKRIFALNQQVEPAITQAFEAQLRLLQACVEDKFMQPLNAKLDKQKEIEQLMQQDSSRIAQALEKARLGLTQLQNLRNNTQQALIGR